MASRGKKKATTNPSKRPCMEKASNNPPFVPTFTFDDFGIVFTDQSHADRFASLIRIRIKPTQFPNEQALRNLGIYDNIKSLHVSSSCEGFLSLYAKTYARLTLEFLSSLTEESRIVSYGDEEREEKYILFRLFNHDHSLSYDRINQIFGWPAIRNLGLKFSDGFNDGIFWNQITGSIWDPRTAKASSIIHPVLRIIHRVYVCTIFGRKDKGTINKAELHMLWTFVTSNGTMNLASWFVNNLWQYGEARFTGEIHIGGLITILARGIGLVIPDDLVDVPGSTYLDIPTLKKMKMIDQRDDKNFTWLVGGDNIPHTILPNPNLLRVRINLPDTWTTPSTIPEALDQVVNQEENPPQQSNQGPQFPPNILNRLNQMFEEHTQMFNQHHQMVQQVNQMAQDNTQVREQVSQIQGQINHVQGRLDNIYDYGAGHWPNFQPPPYVLDTAAERSAPPENGSDECVICLEQERNSVFVPCGHICCCVACSSNLTECPLCRHKIEQVVRTFRN